MTERISDVQQKVRRARLALESLAGRAAELRTVAAERLRAAPPPEPPRPPPSPIQIGDAELADSDDFIADPWEIALINERDK